MFIRFQVYADDIRGGAIGDLAKSLDKCVRMVEQPKIEGDTLTFFVNQQSELLMAAEIVADYLVYKDGIIYAD